MYQPAVCTNRECVPTRSVYQPGVCTNRECVPTGSVYQSGVCTNRECLPTRSVYKPCRSVYQPGYKLYYNYMCFWIGCESLSFSDLPYVLQTLNINMDLYEDLYKISTRSRHNRPNYVTCVVDNGIDSLIGRRRIVMCECPHTIIYILCICTVHTYVPIYKMSPL